MLEMLKARKEELQAQGKKGFTLMEMLIVIAIIAVLIAIAIPVLGAQLENAKEATDAANLRSAYAVASVSAMQDNKDTYVPVKMTQGDTTWDSDVKDQTIGSKKVSSIGLGSTAGGTVYLTVKTDGTMDVVTDAPSGGTWQQKEMNPTS